MRSLNTICVLAFALLCGSLMFGCVREPANSDTFPNLKEIAKLSTIECYYHNVAEIHNDGSNYMFGLLNVGYKKAWFEYGGSIELGIDASKLKIDPPDENGVVSVHMPTAQIIGEPKVDAASFSEVYSDTGLVSPITAKDQTEAYKRAQENMREQAEGDAVLISQANVRAKGIIEQYVQDVGEAQGKRYSVRFV